MNRQTKAAQLDALILEAVRHLPDADGFRTLTDIAAFPGLRAVSFGRVMDRCAKLAAKGKLSHRSGGPGFGDAYGTV